MAWSWSPELLCGMMWHKNLGKRTKIKWKDYKTINVLYVEGLCPKPLCQNDVENSEYSDPSKYSIWIYGLRQNKTDRSLSNFLNHSSPWLETWILRTGETNWREGEGEGREFPLCLLHVELILDLIWNKVCLFFNSFIKI